MTGRGLQVGASTVQTLQRLVVANGSPLAPYPEAQVKIN